MFARIRSKFRASILGGSDSVTTEEKLASWQREADRFIEANNLRAARELYERVLAAVPHNVYALYQLAGALQGLGELGLAAEICDRALALWPDQPGLLNRSGSVARARGKFIQALEFYNRLKNLHPEFPFVDAMIGDQLALLGRHTEALSAFNTALARAPDSLQIQSDRLFILNFLGVMSRRELFEEHRRWGALHEAMLRPHCKPHFQPKDPERKLRIGYLSPDLRRHAVAHFLEGVVREHDNGNFEIHAFDASPFEEDQVTTRLRSSIRHWHKISHLSDDEAAAVVRGQEIDILVDLAGHTAYNRLLVFARRPAPVQVAWFGYINTTGLTSIDYRLVDGWLVPVDHCEDYYTEHLLRVPNATIFEPGAEGPEVGELPAIKNGFVTFASLNQWSKVGDSAKDVWADVLRAVPASRLVIIARGAENLEVRNSITDAFESRGVVASRLDVCGLLPLDSFLQVLNTVDLALDSFPYGGLTTTLHAAWMGVPTVALEGESELARSTPGILRVLGLPELIGSDVAEYRNVAGRMASDIFQLAKYRRQLRQRFKDSPFANARAVVRDVEGAYRAIWRRYCMRGEDSNCASESSGGSTDWE